MGIAYRSIKVPTLVWTAGGGMRVSAQDFLHFKNNGNLVLQDEKGQTLWQTNNVNGGVVYAVMEDTFSLKNKNSSTVWDTFTNPTDTLRRSPLLNFNFSSSLNTTKSRYVPTLTQISHSNLHQLTSDP